MDVECTKLNQQKCLYREKKYNNKSLCAMSIVQTHNHHSLATKIAMIASRRLRTLLGCASAHTRDRCAFVHFSMAILVFLVYSGPLVIVLLTLACARAPLSLSTPHAALSCRFRTPKTGWISTLGAYFFPFFCVFSLLSLFCFFCSFAAFFYTLLTALALLPLALLLLLFNTRRDWCGMCKWVGPVSMGISANSQPVF